MSLDKCMEGGMARFLFWLSGLRDCVFVETGKAGVNFFTQIKTVTQQWKDSTGGSAINLAMPTSLKS